MLSFALLLSAFSLVAAAVQPPAAPANPPIPPARVQPAAPRAILPSEALLFRFGQGNQPRGLVGWRAGASAGSPLGVWEVGAFPDAPSPPDALVLREPAGPGEHFNLCVFQGLIAGDVAVSAWVKPVSGRSDRGGGVAWRVQPMSGGKAEDYYLARWNPLESNFTVSVVVAGARRQLASIDVKGDPDVWHSVAVAHVGAKIEATFDGGARLTVEDATFPGPGLAGVWTKADAATAFDDVSIADATPLPRTPLQVIRRDARALAPLVTSELARRFLSAAADLPSAEPRTVYFDRQARKAYTTEEAARLPDDVREALREINGDEAFYYNTRYGSPLAYARALDLAAAHGFTGGGGGGGGQGPGALSGRAIADFGYGGIGQLRLLASLGAVAVGIDVDPVLAAIYDRPGDTGAIPLSRAAVGGVEGVVGVRGVEGAGGRIALATGQWPGDESVRRVVDGAGPLDLFISKNTLKNGYIHPERPVDERMLVKLGVADDEFVRQVRASLKPGGLLVIYNLCPAPSGPAEPYKPWADGRSPFPRAMLEAAGLEVLDFDRNDDEAARALGRAMGWDRGEQPMDLENDLFAWVTIARRPNK